MGLNDLVPQNLMDVLKRTGVDPQVLAYLSRLQQAPYQMNPQTLAAHQYTVPRPVSTTGIRG